MKVLLINPPYFDVYRGFKSAAKLGALYPPTGLLYIASSLKKAGHQVVLIDVDIEELRMNEIIQKVEQSKVDVVGITATTATYGYSKMILKEIKKKSSIVTIMGGIHITIMMREVLIDTPELDFGIYGEGEETFVELLECFKKKKELNQVKGLIFRNEKGEIEVNSPRPYIENLDELPFPDRSVLKKEKYLWSVYGRGTQKIASIITKRGCPFNCNFCSAHSMFGYEVRYRSIKNVVDEIDEIVNSLGITHIINLDDTLVLDRERMIEFCQEIKKRNLVFTWEGTARANLVEPQIMAMMKEAGLRRISFGIESGNQKILDQENKGITLSELRNAYRWAKNCGIETRGSAIIGHPGETFAGALETIRFIRSIKYLDQVYINIMVPYPGTRVYEMAKNQEMGMRLLCNDFSEFVRYNNSVIEVNNLTRKRLFFLQKFGLIYFFLTPRRIFHNVKRAGFKAGFNNSIAFATSILTR